MMDYAKIVLLLLQAAKWMMDRYHDSQLIQQGTDQEIARASMSVLGTTAAGKKIMEKIDAMGKTESDALTDALSRD